MLVQICYRRGPNHEGDLLLAAAAMRQETRLGGRRQLTRFVNETLAPGGLSNPIWKALKPSKNASSQPDLTSGVGSSSSSETSSSSNATGDPTSKISSKAMSDDTGKLAGKATGSSNEGLNWQHRDAWAERLAQDSSGAGVEADRLQEGSGASMQADRSQEVQGAEKHLLQDVVSSVDPDSMPGQPHTPTCVSSHADRNSAAPDSFWQQ